MPYSKDGQIRELNKAILRYESGRFDTGEFMNEIEGIVSETWDRSREETLRTILGVRSQV